MNPSLRLLRRAISLCIMVLAVSACWLRFGGAPRGADWPMWRYDANRTAASPSELPAELHLQWKRQLPAPRPAFPQDLRLCFDLSHEPVVMDKTMFVPSMVTDSITALDTDTGAEKWEFFADGPVRFAPVASRGKVYFVSDDGYLYCVDAEKGELLWKFSPLPSGQRAYKLLGNERLISRWPGRGGPVLADETVYFAAGIWPFEGVYVCAVDAKTGDLIWQNKDAGLIKDGLIDHGTRRDAGLSPQGYLSVIGGKLIVPSGRALPGFFDPQSGKMEPYTTGWGGRVALAKGCWYVCGIGDYFFQSGDMYGLTARAAAVHAKDKPKELLSLQEFARRANVPSETVQEWVNRNMLVTEQHAGKLLISPQKRSTTTYLSWWTGTPREGEQHTLDSHPRLQIDPANGDEVGVFREPVLADGVMYYSQPINNQRGRGAHWPPNLRYQEIVAYDMTNPKWGFTCAGAWGNRLVIWPTITFDRLWSLPSELRIQIKAGSRLYGGAPGVVAAVDIPDRGGKPKLSWRSEIEGTPSSMLAADQKLFVVTKEGCIYCFGGKQVQPKTYTMKKPPVAAPADKWTKTAGEVLEQAQVAKGYCLALGVGTGRLIEELARQSQLHIIALDPDAERVNAARRRLDAMGLYGMRVHILPHALTSVHLPPYMASLVVSEDLSGSGFEQGTAFVQKLFNSLRPYGGTACLPIPRRARSAFAEWVKQAQLVGARVRRAGEFMLLSRVGALAGSADWTHESGNAANTFASKDQQVKPPFAVLWFGGSVDRIFPPWDYTHSRGPFPLIASGRMFILVANELHATDIYTGQHLWKVALTPSAKTESRRRNHMIRSRETADNFVAAEDSIYVVCGETCLRFDSATGSKLGQIEIPAELSKKGDAAWEEIRVSGELLIGTTGKHLLGMDRRSGEILWRFESRQDRFSFAVGSGKVFCVDYWLPVHRRRGVQKTQQSTIFALDARSGEVLWETTAKTPPDAADPETQKRFPPLKPQLAYEDVNDILLLTANRGTLTAYRGSDGGLLWANNISCVNPPSYWSGPEPPIVLPNLLITHAGEMYEPQTGSRLPKRLWTGMNVNYDTGGARGCGRALANQYVVTLRDGHASYFDLATGHQAFFRGIRSGCTNSLIPAGGILNAPNFAHGCTCNWPIFVSFALAHMPEAEQWTDQ